MRLKALGSRLPTLDIRKVKTAEPKGWDKANERRTLTGRPWRRVRDRIMRRDCYLCQCEKCQAEGLLTPAHEVDHIVPLSQGGTDQDSNLRAINRECHKLKTQRESDLGRRGT